MAERYLFCYLLRFMHNDHMPSIASVVRSLFMAELSIDQSIRERHPFKDTKIPTPTPATLDFCRMLVSPSLAFSDSPSTPERLYTPRYTISLP